MVMARISIFGQLKRLFFGNMNCPLNTSNSKRSVCMRQELKWNYKMINSIKLIKCEGMWLSGKTLDCRPRDCEFDSPPPQNQLNISKRRYVLVLPRKNAPVYKCYTLGMLKNQWFVMCGGRSSILHYVFTKRNKQSVCSNAEWESLSPSLNKSKTIS